MGRKEIEIDYSEVERMAGIGLTNAEIADALGIGQSTLYTKKNNNRSFESALKKGRAKAAVDVANTVYELAVGQKNLTAAIWYEKTRRGLSEKHQGDVDGEVKLIMDVSTDPEARAAYNSEK